MSQLNFIFLIIWLITAAVLLFWKKDWKVFLAGVIPGFLIEIVFVHFKVWTYDHSDLLGVPLWIFLSWGITAVLFYELGVYLKKKN